MAGYDIYIETLATGKEVFSAEFQGMKFFLKYSGVIAKIMSDFAWRVKKKITGKQLDKAKTK